MGADPDEENEPTCPKPFSMRTYLLGLPTKRRQGKIYKPPDPYKFISNVRASAIRGPKKENWRINKLAIPIRVTPKYTPPPPAVTASGLSPATIHGEGTYRSSHLARPYIATLRQTKLRYKDRGRKFVQTINKHIANSWQSIFYHYRRMLLLKQRRKAGPKPKKGAKVPKYTPEELKKREKAMKDCLDRIAKPKPKFKPPPRPKKPIADLNKIAVHMTLMSQPKLVIKKYIRPSIDPQYKDPMRVTDAAKKYVISARVLTLSACPPHRLIKEPVFVPGAVQKSALTCIVSPRFLELAVPKRTAAQKDSDLKENPFGISPTALKYKATPRILELAKPAER